MKQKETNKCQHSLAWGRWTNIVKIKWATEYFDLFVNFDIVGLYCRWYQRWVGRRSTRRFTCKSTWRSVTSWRRCCVDTHWWESRRWAARPPRWGTAAKQSKELWQKKRKNVFCMIITTGFKCLYTLKTGHRISLDRFFFSRLIFCCRCYG